MAITGEFARDGHGRMEMAMAMEITGWGWTLPWTLETSDHDHSSADAALASFRMETACTLQQMVKTGITGHCSSKLKSD